MLINSTVERMRQVGWLVDILQCLKASSIARFVSIGCTVAVVGTVTSGFVTVALSTFTGCHQYPSATYVTVETVGVQKVKSANFNSLADKIQTAIKEE